MSVEQLVGVEASTLLDSLSKRLVEAHAGRGGLEAVIQFLDQIDWLEKVRPLKAQIKSLSVFFEGALSFCTKEQMARNPVKRYREISRYMGLICPKCRFRKSYTEAMSPHLILRAVKSLLPPDYTLPTNADADLKICPNCHVKLIPAYAYSTANMLAEKMTPETPEAVLMNYAYDLLADAFVYAYEAFGFALQDLTKKLGWNQYHIDHRIKAYLDAYFYGRLAGEQKIAREEKEMLQFLARGNMVGISKNKAEQLVRLGVNIVKFGYLHEVLKVPGAEARYEKAVSEFAHLYDAVNSEIRMAMPELLTVQKLRWRFKKGAGYYAPCFKLSKSSWASGQISGDAVLTPFYNLPVFPTAEMGAIQAVYGRVGSGKTFLLSSIICHSFYKRRETVLIPLNDKSNSYSLAALPMFAYSRDTAKVMRLLDVIGVEPRGVPTLTVTVLRKGETVSDLNSHPPTIFDRVIEVDNIATFTPDFNILMDELKAEAEKHDLSVPAGIIVFRNLIRESKTAYIDVEIATRVIEAFDVWRKGHMTRPMRMVLDELSYMASSRVVKYAADKLVAGATITDFIKESRRNNVSVDAATQAPIEVIRELRSASTNVFFRDIPAEKEKTRSPIDVLLESLQLREDHLKPIIRDMNVRGALPKNLWFWFHQPTYEINIIRPAPPTFCIFDPHAKMSPREILNEYEKQTNQKIMLESWSQVKRLEQAKTKRLTSNGRRGAFL